MTKILHLAPELVDQISVLLHVSDKKQLRLACKDLSNLLESSVLHTIVLDITKHNVEKNIDMIKSMATAGTSSAASRSTCVLVLKSLSPRFDRNPQHRASRLIDGHWVADEEPPDGPEIAMAEDAMRKDLLAALASLINVQSVRWIMNRKDEAWAQAIVIEALKLLENLQYLDFDLRNARVGIPMAEFKNIQSVALEAPDSSTGVGDSNPHVETLTSLARMLAKSAPGQFVSLHVKRRYNDVDETASLHHLLRFYPTDAPPLQLNHLGLNWSLVKLDEITMPHFRHLNSLDLSQIVEPIKYARPIRRRFFNTSVPDSVLVEKQLAVGSSANDFWIQIARLGICLERIKLDRIPPAFVTYLKQYNGLKKLNLVTNWFETGQESDACASRFFNEALPNHTQSLEDLDINASYEGLWCFGEHNMSIISQCHRLKTLGVSVLSDLIATTVSTETMISTPDTQDTLDVLLETVTLCIPQLASLYIYPADSEYSRGSWCGTGLLERRSYVMKQINQRLNDYRAPPSLSRLPNVVVGRTTLKPERVVGSDSGKILGTWCYQATSESCSHDTFF